MQPFSPMRRYEIPFAATRKWPTVCVCALQLLLRGPGSPPHAMHKPLLPFRA